MTDDATTRSVGRVPLERRHWFQRSATKPHSEWEKLSMDSSATAVMPPSSPPRRRRAVSCETFTSAWPECRSPARHRRRSVSCEISSTFSVSFNIVNDSAGRRNIHCCLHTKWDRTFHVSLSLRRLVFWLALFLLLVPIGAFGALPRIVGKGVATSRASNFHMWGGAIALGEAPSSPTFHDDRDATFHDDRDATFHGTDPRGLHPVRQSPAETEELEQCIVDASDDSAVQLCVQQFQSSGLDELSSLIVKEGCQMISSNDDGTMIGILGQIMHTAKNEGFAQVFQGEQLKRLATKACVAASIHKLSLCALPLASGCVAHAQDIMPWMDIMPWT